MNSIQTPSLPKEKKRLLFYVLLCSLAFTNFALGGNFIIKYDWNPLFHPYSNSAGSAKVEAEWIVYPNGLGPEHNFYFTSTTPHMANGSEVLFFYFGGNAVFKIHGDQFTQQEIWLNNNPAAQPYIGSRVVLGQTHSVMRYQFANIRSTGPNKVRLTCNNQAASIAVGTSLPQSTIYVSGTHGFLSSGTIQVVSSTGAQNISYTSTTTNGNGHTTSFVGCTGGTGTVTQGSEVNQLSGASSTATHFQNTVSLWNFDFQRWDLVFNQEFDRAALCHDCANCGNCGNWGPSFESLNCGTGVLPPIGVVDYLVSINDEPFVQANASTSSPLYIDPLACNGPPSWVFPYQVISPPNQYHQWIIRSPLDK